MMSEMRNVYARHSAFLPDIVPDTLLRHLSSYAHPLLRFFIRFGYTQQAFEIYPYAERKSRTFATSITEPFVTIVKGWFTKSSIFTCTKYSKCILM